jgi:very-short-patch-repair endonuclease
LVIEIDGYDHFTPEGRQHDQLRSNQLYKKYGLRVLRFSNSDVDDHFEDVCRLIHETVESVNPMDTASY